MPNLEQIQNAQDNSQQFQIGTISIANGITEKRAREICKEIFNDSTYKANEIANKRVNEFANELIPRIELIENNLISFSEPDFIFALKRAQVTAACTDRKNDYKILSELLAHRIKNRNNIKKKASILKAIEIINQIDDDSLYALTMVHAILSYVPTTGNVIDGLSVINNLYNELKVDSLPNDNLWIDNLSICGAITINSSSHFYTFDDILSKNFNGYCCVGIDKNNEVYNKVLLLLDENNISQSILVNNYFLDGYVRLSISTNHIIKDCFCEDNQIQCIEKVFNMYSKDSSLESKVKDEFLKLSYSYNTLTRCKNWWNKLEPYFIINSIGRTIAHTYAKTIDKNIPDLD